MPLACSPDLYGLPRDRIILPEFLGGWSLPTVLAPTPETPSLILRNRIVEMGVFAHSTDEDGTLGKILEDGPIGEASIHYGPQGFFPSSGIPIQSSA
jgi:hypothetical protein